MNNVLVTGSKGQLGLELKKYSKNIHDFTFIFKDLPDLDISDYAAVKLFFINNNIDIVINCAAYTDVDDCELNKEIAFDVNYNAINNIIKVLSINNGKLIHISTDYVFDGKKFSAYSEKDKPRPLNIYGTSKLKGEECILKSDLDALIIRTSWLYSSYGNNFVKKMIRLMKEKDEINVINDQVGSPTYAGDLASSILKMLNFNSSLSGIYNFSNEGKISWYEFANSIKQIYGLKTRIIGVSSLKFKTIAKRPKFSLLDKSKIKRTFNLEIPNYKKSLKNCIEIIKNEA